MVNVVSLALAVALLASLLVNYALADQLQKAVRKIRVMQDERYW